MTKRNKYDAKAFMRRTGCCETVAYGYGGESFGQILPQERLQCARTKPKCVSDARWRMELSRRRMEAVFVGLNRKMHHRT